ncbi:nuclear receptor-binding factor 2-like isoform X2 [Limulus polyphemus]|uniref:Nuclear receptor-binding factor 2-like isoform X2 n=1 Tax=Limulus polyphemus TaxID=6850 RepID=A0ABM1BME7_LIMPO|nr:nuclear receptor-binding factor 2-like isoform X2 [Limulus polyphemus]
METSLNFAHQQYRKAEHFLKSGKFEEAISCHQRAAGLLQDALKQTNSDKAKESLILQSEFHLRQEAVVRYKQNSKGISKKARENIKAEQETCNEDESVGEQSPSSVEHIQFAILQTMAENDYLLQFLIQPSTTLVESSLATNLCESNAQGAVYTPRNDKALIQELQLNNEDLKRLLQQLTVELERVTRENEHLRNIVEELQRKTIWQGTRRLHMINDLNSHYPFSSVNDPSSGLRDLPALTPLEVPNFDFALLKKEATRTNL